MPDQGLEDISHTCYTEQASLYKGPNQKSDILNALTHVIDVLTVMSGNDNIFETVLLSGLMRVNSKEMELQCRLKKKTPAAGLSYHLRNH